MDGITEFSFLSKILIMGRFTIDHGMDLPWHNTLVHTLFCSTLHKHTAITHLSDKYLGKTTYLGKNLGKTQGKNF